jgi:hypothetical protein
LGGGFKYAFSLEHKEAVEKQLDIQLVDGEYDVWPELMKLSPMPIAVVNPHDPADSRR